MLRADLTGLNISWIWIGYLSLYRIIPATCKIPEVISGGIRPFMGKARKAGLKCSFLRVNVAFLPMFTSPKAPAFGARNQLQSFANTSSNKMMNGSIDNQYGYLRHRRCTRLL